MMAGNVRAVDTVAVPFGDPTRPTAKPGSIPLEAMIRMTETIGGNAKQPVELGVGSGDHHRQWAQAVQNRSFEDAEAFGVDMLDRFDEHRAVEAMQSSGGFEQRRMNEFDLAVDSILRIEPGAQAGKRAAAQIDPDDTVDCARPGDPNEKVAIAATQIEDRPRALGTNNPLDGLQTLFMQPARH